MARAVVATRRWTASGGRRFLQRAGFGLVLCLSTNGLPAQELRCENGIVSRGDAREDVRLRCGAPDHIERWDGVPPAMEGAVWFYNAGASRLLRMLQFRGNRLIRIENDSYGFSEPVQPSCRPGEAAPGWSAYRLIAMCGPPTSRQIVGNLLVPRRNTPTGTPLGFGQRAVHRQRWRYDFGPRNFIREFTLDNASVVEVRTLGRGGAG